MATHGRLIRSQGSNRYVSTLPVEYARKIESLPVLRYGDTSPLKCYLLKEDNGYYTVYMENGRIIRDVIGWFKPFYEESTGKEGM